MTAELLRSATLPRLALRGPLVAWADRLSSLPPGLSAAEDATLQQLGLRLDAAAPGVRAVEALLGQPLPTTASTSSSSGGVDVAWLGPDEWLVLAPAAHPVPAEALAEAAATCGGTVVDVSAQRTTLRLRGALVPELLRGGCAVDLHRSVFVPGCAVQTSIAQIGVLLLAREAGGTDVTLLVRSTFAGALADWILDAAVEFTSADTTADEKELP